jgi:hypothetical protein
MTGRWAIVLVTLAVLIVAALGIYWIGRRDGAAGERPKIAAAQAQAALANLETEGAAQTLTRVETAVRRRETAARGVADLTHEALKSEDANALLDPDRAGRLHDADRRLCDAAPELAGCAADRDAG